jgi:malate dehydrogenase
MKITIVGAGNVGAICAIVIAEKELGNEVVLLDVKRGLAEGKSIDIMQMAPLALFDTKTIGVTDDYSATANSHVVVIAAGFPRKPGMHREDLINTNALIVKNITENALKYSPEAIFIVVTNPLDAMAYCAFKSANIPSNRVIGMAGLVDTARYRYFLSEELQCSSKEIQAIILGGHGDHMVPIPRYTTVNGVPVTQLISTEKLDDIIRRTRIGGGELVNLMGKSAWFAPGYAAARMVEAIVLDQKRYFPCSVYLSGQYGLDDIFFGVPVRLGINGVENIMEIELNDSEKALVERSANSVRENIKILYSKKILTKAH